MVFPPIEYGTNIKIFKKKWQMGSNLY